MTALTQDFVHTIDTTVTGSAEFVGAAGAHLGAVGTQIGAVFTAFTARTNHGTIAAVMTVHTKAVGFRTEITLSTFLTVIIGTAGTSLTTFHAYNRAVGTAVAAGTDHLHTGDAQTAIITEISLTDAIRTDAAIGAKFIVCTFTAFIIALRAYPLHTF